MPEFQIVVSTLADALVATKLASGAPMQQMTGVWTHEREGQVLGTGMFRGGAAQWTSFRIDGSRLAEGAFVKSHAHGEWKIFHPSGRLAAVGKMRAGKRDGTWKFFYDNATSSKPSVGLFSAGETVGSWKHFDEHGALVATVTGAAWTGITLHIVANAAGVRHEVHQGLPAEAYRLDGLYLGKDRLYENESGERFDGDSNHLQKTANGWIARACKWSRKRKAAAKAGDATTLHELMLKGWAESNETRTAACTGKPVPVATARAQRYELMIASRSQKRAPIPAWNIDPRPAAPDEVAVALDHPADMATYLTQHSTWYMEWPHVDGTFRALYRSLPGYMATEG